MRFTSRQLHLVASALVVLLACLYLPAAGEEKADKGKKEPAAPPVLKPEVFGIPDQDQCYLSLPFGMASYDGRLKFHRYTLEILTAASLEGDAVRSGSFRTDYRFPSEIRSGLSDYKAIAENYDRGHLVPSADLAEQDAQDATFALSNIAPQHKKLNRGPWKQLEAFLRETASREDVRAVWVVTIPLFCPGDTVAEIPGQGTPSEEAVMIQFAGRNHVPIPTHFAKSALVLGKREDNPVALMSWIMPNRAPHDEETIDTHRCPVDLVEHWSGLDLWSQLPQPLQDRLESRK